MNFWHKRKKETLLLWKITAEPLHVKYYKMACEQLRKEGFPQCLHAGDEAHFGNDCECIWRASENAVKIGPLNEVPEKSV